MMMQQQQQPLKGMPSYKELINKLSEVCGIIPEYLDIFGNKHTVSIETQRAILSVMRLNIGSGESIQKEIAELKARPWNRLVEPVNVVSINNQPLTIPVHIPVEDGRENKLAISWSICNEMGRKDEFILEGSSIVIQGQNWIDGRRYVKIDIKDSGHRDIGYYMLSVLCKSPEMEIFGTSRVIITPDVCYLPPELEHGKAWGLSINLYSVRSDRNWGAGDFTDLKRVVEWTSGLKGSFVGINPLHALSNKKPFGISPYSPISRLYKNFIYLDVENIPEVKELIGQWSMVNGQWKEIEAQIDELRDIELIDYERLASLKEKIVRYAFDVFYEKEYLSGERGRRFKKYMEEEGDALESFVTYTAISKKFGEAWQGWPDEYRTSSSSAVQKFRETHAKETLFYKYIQWLIDEQLKEAADETRGIGMLVGLYHDLAIGSTSGGSDTWNFQEVIAEGVDLGAPPDDFNPTGQNWGFSPFIPEKLKESGYALFIQTIRKNMQHFGALRIDHALGMFRQFWIPKGMPASHGAYVKQPTEDLLRIIALESVRNRTVVIAEDLGTIGENVRETLFRFRMLSYSLLYFERNYPDPSFTPPERYPEMALCAVTTHDLPTIHGWWIGRDIDLKKRLGIFSDESAWQRNISERERDKSLLIEVLQSQGLIPDAHSPIHPFTHSPYLGEMSPELCLAIYEYLARTPCKLLAVSLDDAIGTLDQQNMPGITDSYPSWMQKTPVALEQMILDNWFSVLSEMFQKNKR